MIPHLPKTKNHFKQSLLLWMPELFLLAWLKINQFCRLFPNTYPDLHYSQGVWNLPQISPLLNYNIFELTGLVLLSLNNKKLCHIVRGLRMPRTYRVGLKLGEATDTRYSIFKWFCFVGCSCSEFTSFFIIFTIQKQWRSEYQTFKNWIYLNTGLFHVYFLMFLSH